MRKHLIDVLDVDGTWFEKLVAYSDPTYDLWYFPRESMERLIDPEEELDDGESEVWLLDGSVEATYEPIAIGDAVTDLWAVRQNELTTRPSATKS